MMTFRFRRTALLFSAVAMLAAAAPVASAQEDTVMLGDRRVVVWHPHTAAGGRQPVVIFSHGLGGCPTQSRFMTEGLAERGYWVFAPFHRDAGCGKKGPVARSPIPFDEPSRWNSGTFSGRIDDINAVIAALSAAPWSERVDLTRLAIAGHSLGGYTAMGFAGGWPSSSKAPVARAVLAMAPYADPFLVHGTLSDFDVPVMYQGGTLDVGISRSLQKRGGVYDRTGGPKYLVEFTGARHSSWGNKVNRAHDAMLTYAGAFLDMYVRGIDAGTVLTHKLPGVADLRSSARGVIPSEARNLVSPIL